MPEPAPDNASPPPSPEAAPRPPQQARSRRTLARIVNAGLALIDAGGVEAVTVQDVVDRAGTSVGSFYARFPGKDEFLRYLEDTVWREAREGWDEEVGRRLADGGSLQERVRVLVTLLVESHGAPSPLRAGQGSEQDPRSRAFHAHVESSVAAQLLAGEGGAAIGHEDPEAALRLGYAAVAGAVREPPEGWNEERLVTELTRLWLAYLGHPEGGGDHGGEAVDYFDVWG